MKPPQLLGFNYKCQVYGHHFGYYGEEGGWIYKEGEMIPVCQGWHNFYKSHGRKIEAFMEARYKASTSIK